MVAIKATDIDIVAKFKDKAERKLAKQLLDRYLADFNVETISDINTLQEIIYLEVVQVRLQDKLNEMYDSETKAVPLHMLEPIHKNSEVILKLKNSLGLNKAKDKQHGYDALQHYLKRFRVWLDQNQATRMLKCPHCFKRIVLLMKTDAWDALKHPLFKDNMIYNKMLFSNLGKKVTVDAAFIAKVLEVSPSYIDWVINKVRQQPTDIEVQNALNQPTPTAK